jgi:GDP-L-fucose synthase
MKILITGGNGFIARNIFEQLKDKYEISCPDKENLDLLNAPKVFGCIKKNKFDAIIHTATYDAAKKHSVKDPNKVLENNLKMFFNIARCKYNFGKMIYFGSGAEYSREHWIPKMEEDYFDRYVPSDQYGFSKYLMTKYALSNDRIYNLRIFAMIGKYDDWKTRFVSNACYQAIETQKISIEQNAFYDYLDIQDLTKIVEWSLENTPKEKVYNVCSGNTYDRKSIAEKIIKTSGKKIEIIIKNKDLGKEYSGNNTLLLKELNGFKFTPIDLSIKYLYKWFTQDELLRK